MTLRCATAVAAVLCAGAAHAQVCEEAKALDPQRLLRRLSLDLRGHVPTHQEQLVQRELASVPEEAVDDFLASTGFLDVMRRYHADILWPNLDATEVDPLSHRLFPVEVAPGDTVYMSFIKGLYVRALTQQFAPCANQPAQFDAAGALVFEPLVVDGQTVANQEGWVLVEPYWAPGTQVKVCGLDAQTAATAPACSDEARASPYLRQLCENIERTAAALGVPLKDAPTDCGTQFSFLAPGCGCGPNLERCNTAQTAALIRASFLEQQMRLVDRVIAGDRPYTDVLLEKEVEVNGYLAHYLRHQSRLSFDLFGETDASAPVPSTLGWDDGDAWTPIARTGRHAGLLTTAGYLMKFQSNRARAHRYYNAFECGAFTPSGTLPSANEACSKQLDLTKRCGCDTCHRTLEPMSASWGRFAEYGFTPLAEARYPKRYESVCTNFQTLDQIFRCFRFYLVQAEDPQESPFVGMLRPYVFRTATDQVAIEEGPGQLAQASIESGRFASCTVRRMWSHFMRRQPTPDEEATVLPELTTRFAADGHSVRALVRRIVTHPAYGRQP